MTTTRWNLIKLHTIVKLNERKCCQQGSKLYLSLLPSYFPLLLFLFGAYHENYWMLFDNNSYNGKAQWKEVQSTGVITLIYLMTELSPIFKFKHVLGETSVFDAMLENNTHLVILILLGIFCPEQNSETTWRNWLKLGT